MEKNAWRVLRHPGIASRLISLEASKRLKPPCPESPRIAVKLLEEVHSARASITPNN